MIRLFFTKGFLPCITYLINFSRLMFLPAIILSLFVGIYTIFLLIAAICCVTWHHGTTSTITVNRTSTTRWAIHGSEVRVIGRGSISSNWLSFTFLWITLTNSTSIHCIVVSNSTTTVSFIWWRCWFVGYIFMWLL